MSKIAQRVTRLPRKSYLDRTDKISDFREKHIQLITISPSFFIVELPWKKMGGGELVGRLLDHCGWCDNQSRPLFLPLSALIVRDFACQYFLVSWVKIDMTSPLSTRKI